MLTFIIHFEFFSGFLVKCLLIFYATFLDNLVKLLNFLSKFFRPFSLFMFFSLLFNNTTLLGSELKTDHWERSITKSYYWILMRPYQILISFLPNLIIIKKHKIK